MGLGPAGALLGGAPLGGGAGWDILDRPVILSSANFAKRFLRSLYPKCSWTDQHVLKGAITFTHFTTKVIG